MAETPKLSVIVATGTPAGDSNACRSALAAQQFPSDELEIVETPIAVGDLGGAWNRGAARAHGRVLLFLRDDIIPSPTLAAKHFECWQKQHRFIVGPTEPDPRAERLSRYYVDHAGSESPIAECCGRTLLIDRELVREGGVFADGLAWGTEAELAFRLSCTGVAMTRLADPVGIRRVPSTFRGIADLLDAEGRASVELYRRHPPLLPLLKLGAFASAGEGALYLRRVLLALRAPGKLLGLVGGVLPDGQPRKRWYRFLSDYFYWRGVRRALGDRDLWRRFAHGPVVLMYHAIGADGEAPGCYIVPYRRFVRQMRWLKLAGYRVIGMEELVRCNREHRLPPARSVVITFDDGYHDNGALATPALQRLELTATFFLVTGRMGMTNTWDRQGELVGRPLLSWADGRRMLEAGMTLGAHTRTHPALPDLTADQVRHEIEDARQDFVRELALTPALFAYPYGRFDASTPSAVERAGYAGACCSRSGVNDPSVSPFLMRRLEVRGTDSLFQFALGVHRGRARRRRGVT